MYKQIHHVSLEVKKLKRARAFYEKVLKFEVCPDRPNFDFEGIWYTLGNTQLHLIVNPSFSPDDQPTLNSRSAHFAVRVESIDELISILEEAGCTYLDKPASKTGWHQVFVQDPDGNIIEFNA